MRTIFKLAILFLFLGLVQVSAQQTPTDDFTPQNIEKFADEFISGNPDLAGLTAALVVVKDGKIVFHKGYGKVAPGRDETVNPEQTVFLAASVAKVITATAVMQLVEQGKIKLDDDVNIYLKDFKIEDGFGKPVTVENLLTHTAGFEDKFLGAMTTTPEQIQPLGEYLAANMPRRAFAPGLQISYSNHGMALAGFLVESVSGMPFAEYVQKNIFAPLKMNRSSFVQPIPPELLAAMVVDSRGVPPFLNPSPAGAMVTTADDMAQFLIAHLENGANGDGRILKPETVTLMHKKHFSANENMPGVALGFFETSMNGRHVLFHTGDRGHHSVLFLLPEERTGFYFIYTGSNAEASLMREDFSRKFMARFFPSAPNSEPSLSTWNSDISIFAGTYRFNQYNRSTLEKLAALPQQITVSETGEKGVLKVQLGLFSDDLITLNRVGESLFRDKDGAYVNFRPDENGQIKHLDFAGDSVGDPGGAMRIAWYENSLLHLIIIAFAYLVFSSRVLLIPLQFLRRIRRKRKNQEIILSPTPARLAWMLSGLASSLFLAAPILVIITLISIRSVITTLPVGIKIALNFYLLAAILTPILLAGVVFAWKQKWWTRGWRIYFSLVVSALCLIIPVFWYWNLVGIRF